ncbi:hypothetical protein [Nocardiopsis listeri]|uniref:hypothetical protein n=1 Tax=Nocardiopsis listeri TaxID=53440 RepID=UPI0012ED37F5|nr:hypothetical protein [Nocardiopsis listeri]
MWSLIEAAAWIAGIIAVLAGIFFGALAVDWDVEEAGCATGVGLVLIILLLGGWSFFFGLPGGGEDPPTDEETSIASTAPPSTPSDSAPPATTDTPQAPADPYIIADPASGPPGSSFTVTGEGFEPNSRVRIAWAHCGSGNALRDLDTDESGEFSVQLEVPRDLAPGTWSIKAFDPASSGACSGRPDTPFIVE